ncbi:hypothetical protein ECC02_007428 [Trypanosoma cruzi]|uniref:Uncharacterized protein n=1 Tax=Trypanosoma cruzi TaxID=5693 RepID=A0A7J6XYJ2_TRYCR|nr:hypothetical protein ECC02_007428 [Trypanosoma cruzi]
MESNRGDERCGRHTQRAHRMRREQQPGMHRTPHTTHGTHSNPRQHAHTHTQSCRSTNTQMEEGEANRSGTQGSTACTYGESGPSCRTPHGGCAHTQEEVQRPQQQKSKVTIKKGDPRTPRGLLVHGKCSQYSSQKQFSCPRPSFIFSARHFIQAREPPQQQPHTQQQQEAKEGRWCGRQWCCRHWFVCSSYQLCWRLLSLLLYLPQSLLSLCHGGFVVWLRSQATEHFFDLHSWCLRHPARGNEYRPVEEVVRDFLPQFPQAVCSPR